MPMEPGIQLGIVYALAAGVLWGLVPLLVKRGLVRSDVNAAVTLQQFAAVGTLVVVWGIAFDATDLSIPLPALITFIALGFIGAFFGRIFLLKAIEQIGASKAQSIKNASPLLTGIIAVSFLGESVGPGTAIGIVLLVGGILLITRAETRLSRDDKSPLAFGNALLSMAFYSLGPILKRLGVLQGGAPIFGALITQVTGLILIVLLGSLLRVRLQYRGVPFPSILCFIGSGVIHALATAFTFLAVTHAPAVIVGPIWNIQPLVTFSLAHFALKGVEVVRLHDGVAAVLIVIGVFLLAWK